MAKEDRSDRASRTHGPDDEKLMKRGYKHALSLQLNATGTRDNVTYHLSVDADGMAKKKDRDGNFTKARAFLAAHVVVKGANGTVLREGDLRLKLKLHMAEDGNWTWHLLAVGKKGKDMPKLGLKGDATQQPDGTFALEGAGKMVFKPNEEKRSIPVKLETSGRLTLG